MLLRLQLEILAVEYSPPIICKRSLVEPSCNLDQFLSNRASRSMFARTCALQEVGAKRDEICLLITSNDLLSALPLHEAARILGCSPPVDTNIANRGRATMPPSGAN